MLFLLFLFSTLADGLSSRCSEYSRPYHCFMPESRWRFKNGICEQFMGCPGEGNNFNSLAGCEKECMSERREPLVSTPCAPYPDTGMRCIGAQEYYEFDGGSCQRRFACPPSNSFRTKHECESKCTTVSESIPCAPLHPDRSIICVMAHDYFEFDGSSCQRRSSCIPGFGFRTKQECESKCSTAPRVSTACAPFQPDLGMMCIMAHEFFAFDGSSCQPRSGCIPVGFSTLQECERECPDNGCTSFCAQTFCPVDTVCGRKNGKCGCHPSDVNYCSDFCSKARCSISTGGSSCGSKGGRCGCYSETGDCSEYCSKSRCATGTECGQQNEGCGCNPTPRQNDCAGFCRRARCGSGTECGSKKGECGCHPKKNDCRDFCSRTRCAVGNKCGSKNGRCGCYSSKKDECSDYCSRTRCEYGTVCFLKNGRCGCHPRRDNNCADFCRRRRCGSGTSCGEKNGRCGCHSQADNDNGCSVCSRMRCSIGMECARRNGRCGCHFKPNFWPSFWSNFWSKVY